MIQGEVLPANIIEEIRRFLEEGRSATIALDVRAGKVMQMRIPEQAATQRIVRASLDKTDRTL